MVGKSPLSELEDVVEAPPRHTAESIASSHFKKELELHDKDNASPADTVVILHDSCYGHRYSRVSGQNVSREQVLRYQPWVLSGDIFFELWTNTVYF